MKQAVLLLASLLMGVGLFAQDPGAAGPPPQGGQPPSMGYDATREVTLQGTVTAVKVTTHGPGPFVSLTFLAEGSTYDVMVGPQAVLAQHSLTLAEGDALTLVGVASTGERGARFRARTLTKDGASVTLLKANGSPAGRP